MAAISIDSVELLRDFSDRAGIGFPLLADPESGIIGAFDLVNVSVPRDHPAYGFAYPGYYLLDADGVVVDKFFQEENADRTTAANILVRRFGEDGESRQGEAETPHLKLAWTASNDSLRPGQRVLLILEVEIGEGMHLYAPGEHRYIAVDWEMDDPAGAEILEAIYPPAETKHLAAIRETVPVYHDSIRIIRDLHLLGDRALPRELRGRDRLEVTGRFKYQACDADRCYFPASIPVTWTFRLQEHDLIRAPETIRRGAPAR